LGGEEGRRIIEDLNRFAAQRETAQLLVLLLVPLLVLLHTVSPFHQKTGPALAQTLLRKVERFLQTEIPMKCTFFQEPGQVAPSKPERGRSSPTDLLPLPRLQLDEPFLGQLPEDEQRIELGHGGDLQDRLDVVVAAVDAGEHEALLGGELQKPRRGRGARAPARIGHDRSLLMTEDPLDRIAINPEVMLGKPVIRGTRITVEILLEKIAAGYSMDEILADYPRLTREDVLAAVAVRRGN
jgi:uncharacterized protein (DUF433 family)